MTTQSIASTPSLSRAVAARMPFFWWRQQAERLALPQPRRTAARLPADDAYIPTGTADLWRSARPRPLR